jgi:hypothetical protein
MDMVIVLSVLYIVVAGLLILNVMLWAAVEALTAEVHFQEKALMRMHDHIQEANTAVREVTLPGESFDWGKK